MYSVQHVLWRGAMAVSLLVVGGVGAGVSPQSVPAVHDEFACEDTAFVFDGVQGSLKSEVALVSQQPLQVFDTVVIQAIRPVPEEA